jgi:hypothetical protein
MKRHDRNDQIASPLRSRGLRLQSAPAWAFTFLFAGRVLAQAIQRWWPQPFLPTFGRFQGSGLAYPLLFSSQLVILALMVWMAGLVTSGSWHPAPRRLRALSIFGCLYMAASVLRILIGWLMPTAPEWFRAWIPGFFHLVLAGFVITMALSAPQRLTDSNEPSGRNP